MSEYIKDNTESSSPSQESWLNKTNVIIVIIAVALITLIIYFVSNYGSFQGPFPTRSDLNVDSLDLYKEIKKLQEQQMRNLARN